MQGRAVVACSALLLLSACLFGITEAKPSYSKTPNPKWARKPHKALRHSNDDQEELIVPITYEPIRKMPDVPQIDPLHVRAGDNSVVIHPDEDSGFNATGTYQGGSGLKENKVCCTICPAVDECSHSNSGCYRKCHKTCGPHCVIPKEATAEPCELQRTCGLVAAASSSASSSESEDDDDDVVVVQTIKSSQDMATGPEHAVAKTKDEDDGTPEKPNPKWARYPTGPTGPTGPPAMMPTGPAGHAVEPSTLEATGPYQEETTESLEELEMELTVVDSERPCECKKDPCDCSKKE